MNPGRLLPLVLACALLPAAVLAVTDEDRVAANQVFLSEFGGQRYAQALPLAERVVALTEEQYGVDARALVNPLTNLGTTYLRLRNFEAAEQQYKRAVAILETNSGVAERGLIAPLHGLGETYLDTGQPGPAAEALKRSVDLSRNTDGLYNEAQLEIVRPLIAAYVAANRLEDAEQEHQYAFRVAESAYGRDDPRMLQPLDDYARWYEFVGRYATSRALYGRALALAERTHGRNTRATVDPLRGIARTYRLEYLYGPEETVDPSTSGTLSAGLPPINAVSNTDRLNPDGERALRIAIETLASEPVDRLERGDTLVELGDWYLTGSESRLAADAYAAAWDDLVAAGDTQQLDAPRPIAYRAPATAISRFKGGDIEDYDERSVEAMFTVTTEGRLDAVEVRSSDAPKNAEKSVVSALRRARYAPRIVDGRPVDTPGVVHREVLLIKKPRDKR